MCGIFGIISRTRVGLVTDDCDILKQMLLDTAQRGDDSTGLYMTDYQHPKDPPTGVKVIGGPHNIVYNETLWTDIERFTSRHAGAIIGHGRSATRGTVNVKNAHPFQHEHITLVHNGTLHSGVSYGKKGDDHIEVDSHGLAVAIAEKGIQEALLGVRGAYAIVVHDQKEGALYICRNNDRPLHIYSTPTRHYLLSEGVFLDAIMQRYSKTVAGESVKYFRPEQLIRIDLFDPSTYRNVADLAKMRQEREDAERELRRKEDEERRKNNPHVPVNIHSFRERQKKEEIGRRETSLKMVTFAVDNVEPYGVNYKYTCHDTNMQHVCFISDQCKRDYIGRVGSARVHSYVKKDGVERIFVRHREITWLPFDLKELNENLPLGPVAANGEEPANAGFFLTYNNKRIAQSAWHEKIKHEGCDTCALTFGPNDHGRAVLTDDNLLLCVSCAKEFSVGIPDKEKLH